MSNPSPAKNNNPLPATVGVQSVRARSVSIGWLSSDWPVKPSSVPFFYGWLLLPVMVLGLLASSPGQTAGVSPFVDALIGVTDLSRVWVSLAYMVGTISSAIMLPSAGKLLDRYGTRLMSMLAGVLLCCVLMFMSLLQFAVGWYTGLVGQAAGSWLSLAWLMVGFAFMRLSGQGMLTMCSQTTIGHWFDRRRGLATAISGLMLSVSMNAMPLVFNELIELVGWTWTWRLLGLAVGPVFGLIAWVLWRDTPESCGLLPDGGRSVGGRRSSRSSDYPWTRGQAIRTLGFWTVVGTLAMLGLIITADAFHLADLGARMGLSREQSLGFMLPFGITAIVLGLPAGLLADRLDARPLVLGMLLMLLLHLYLMQDIRMPWRYYGAAMAMGAAAGLSGPVGITTFPRFFGRAHLGEINGAQWSLVVFASAIGPAFYALVLHLSGAYQPAMWLLTLPVGLLLLLGLSLKAPVPPKPV